MASGNAIRAGRAFVEIFADSSKLPTGLRSASNQLKDWGKSVQNIGRTMFTGGAAVTGALVGAGVTFSKVGDDLAKAAKRSGTTAAELSGLRHAADLSGVSAEELETSVSKMRREIGKSGPPAKELADALAALGVSQGQLAGQKLDAQLGLIADGFNRLTTAEERTAAVMALFGRSGTSLIPMFQEGSAGIAAMVADAERLGLVWRNEDAKAAEELNDALGRLWATVKKLTVDVGQQLAPVLKAAAEWLTQVAVTTSQWVKANGPAVVMALQVAAAVTVAGAAVFAFGTALVAAGAICASVGAIISALPAIIGTVTAVIGAMATPLGLVVVGITAAIVALELWAAKAVSETAPVKRVFGEVRESWDAMSAAMKGGDMAAAMAVLWSAIKMEWVKGINAIQDMWTRFKARLDLEVTALLAPFTGDKTTMIVAKGIMEFRDRDLAENAKQLEQATKAWQDAVAAARAAGEPKPEGNRPQAPEPYHEYAALGKSGYMFDKAEPVAEAIAQAETKGTFSGSAQALMGLAFGQSAQERTAKAAEQTARAAEETAENTEATYRAIDELPGALWK